MGYKDNEEVPIEVHQPCDACGSSDAMAIYEDHTFCFSCGDYKYVGNLESIRMDNKDWSPVAGGAKPLKARGLTKETCRKFGYTIGKYNGETVQIATYRLDGKIVGQKIRPKNKNFRWLGEKNPPLYGQHLWKAGGKKLCIVEGEIDALSLSQVQDNKWPVVSIPNGATSAARSIKNNLEYINSFEQVILMFDMDEPGRDATNKCAPLIAPGKCCVAQLPLKDPNEMLVAGQSSELISAMWNAIPYTPEGIVCGSNLFSEMERLEPFGLSYPFPGVSGVVRGIRRGEVVTLIADTGIGKSQVLKEIAYHLLHYHKETIGCFFMEESNSRTVQNLIGMHMNRPIHLPEVTSTSEERKKHFDLVLNNDRAYFYTQFGATDIDSIKSKMRYLAVSCGVKYFFIDHMSCFAISKNAIADERKKVDVAIATFAGLVRELNVTMFLISHINRNTKKEGKFIPTLDDIRSSAAIAQWSDVILGLSREPLHDDPNQRNYTSIRVLKQRFSGEAGDSFTLYYNKETGRITEVDTPKKKEEPHSFKDETHGDF